MLECVVNISEGRDLSWLEGLSSDLASLADLHHDVAHHRSVLTLLGHADALIDDVVALGRVALGRVDLREHQGVHPRLGALDVVPFVPIGSSSIDDAVGARDRCAARLAEELALPIFLYGPLGGSSRSLPELRRTAFRGLEPDLGPRQEDPRHGAVAVGARETLVAWNLWLDGVAPGEAQAIAAAIRTPEVRALGMDLGASCQVSCNLIAATRSTPAMVADQVAARLGPGGRIIRAELVGLSPAAVLDLTPRSRWEELDLSEEQTIEAACGRLGLELV